jgi:Tfp pilus assembly protein PilF
MITTRAKWLEMTMRLLPIGIVAGLGAALIASSGSSQAPGPDSVLNPQSVQLTRQGETALAGGNFQAADDALELALVVDPRNRQAFVALAKVAQKQKLYGQAIRYTNKALALEPNDLNALTVQGEAMVEMGAVARAQQNLAKVRKICGGAGCPQGTTLAAAIARGPAMAVKATPAAKQN